MRHDRPAGLPVAALDDPERERRLLVDHREDLVAKRTRHVQRLRWHLLDLGIDEPGPRSLDRAAVLADLEVRRAGRTEPAARLARDLLGRVRDLAAVIRPLEREIETIVAALAPALLAQPGCGPLTTAKIVGETAGMSRFRSKEAFARHNGSAPVPVWSGNVTRHRRRRISDRAFRRLRADEAARVTPLAAAA